MGGPVRGLAQPKSPFKLTVLIMVAFIALPLAVSAVDVPVAHAATQTIAPQGRLDCNGYSKIQKLSMPYLVCADFVGYDGGRGYDNGHYIGHDEPTVTFFSSSPGSGNNLQWQITLPKEQALPATQSFENFITFWFSVDLCDPKSFPFNPCIPDSDKNPIPRFANDPSSAGSAVLELQFYPPGSPEHSCDLTRWCAEMNIDSLEVNPNCMEPINLAFIQRDGIPTAPPGPGSPIPVTSNAKTLLMKQGDKLVITIKDTANGLLNRVEDKTTGQSGFMVASAANGFQNTNPFTCATTPFSFHPEFSTAKFGNFLSWGPSQINVAFDTEIGHFTPGPNGDGDPDDAPCYSGPIVPGCTDHATGGDLDFDGSSYLPDWPDGTKNTPISIQIGSVLGNGIGPISSEAGESDYQDPYAALQFNTALGGSESTCMPDGSGCVVPPPGAVFYPFFAQSGKGASCRFTFGNDIRGATIDDFGRDAQYGTSNVAWSFLDISSGIRPNPCTPTGGGKLTPS